jgi:hypothetical protein
VDDRNRSAADAPEALKTAYRLKRRAYRRHCRLQFDFAVVQGGEGKKIRQANDCNRAKRPESAWANAGRGFLQPFTQR